MPITTALNAHEFAVLDPQRIRHADWLEGMSYRLSGDAWATNRVTNRVTLGVGGGLLLQNGWALVLDLGGELAKGAVVGDGAHGASKRF
ncbi:hypothetical protein [Caulobacter sp.]|uniref:hypothetical protein n=1 Tax=Caulobacter sp. TaxID=78 RepID=UPI002B49424E|nr:hypothetical protein [Caulobacter sp.]HJV42591.1 hypothetical protein [Caulobacter sp.]